MRKYKVLVTGGSGFLGSCLVESFLASGYDVSATYFRRRPRSGSLAKWYRWDMRCRLDLPAPGFDFVVHNASTLSCEPSEVAAADIPSFFNLLPVARGSYFAYISSMDVFPRSRRGALTPLSPCAPETWYGLGKRLTESAVMFGLEKGCFAGAAVLRLPYVLGVHSAHRRGFWGRLGRALSAGSLVKVGDIPSRGWGANGLSWTSPDHVSACLARLFSSRRSGVFHAAGGFVSWREVFSLASAISERRIRAGHVPGAPEAFTLLPDRRKLVHGRGDGLPRCRGRETFKDFLGAMMEAA